MKITRCEEFSRLLEIFIKWIWVSPLYISFRVSSNHVISFTHFYHCSTTYMLLILKVKSLSLTGYGQFSIVHISIYCYYSLRAFQNKNKAYFLPLKNFFLLWFPNQVLQASKRDLLVPHGTTPPLPDPPWKVVYGSGDSNTIGIDRSVCQ